VGDYRDSTKPALLAVIFPLKEVYHFEAMSWSTTHQTLQLSNGSEIVDAELGANVPVSVSLVDLDGKALIIKGY
jgi:hypothetical protein